MTWKVLINVPNRNYCEKVIPAMRFPISDVNTYLFKTCVEYTECQLMSTEIYNRKEAMFHTWIEIQRIATKIICIFRAVKELFRLHVNFWIGMSGVKCYKVPKVSRNNCRMFAMQFQEWSWKWIRISVSSISVATAALKTVIVNWAI